MECAVDGYGLNFTSYFSDILPNTEVMGSGSKML